jgi:hypothetical protein
MLSVLRPFVAYLRVYEPLSAFDEPISALVKQAVDAERLTRASVGEHERKVWLMSQREPIRLLPAESADGQAAPGSELDFLVLDPAEADGLDMRGKSHQVYICPLEIRARSAAALVNFLGDASAPLLDSVLGTDEKAVESARVHTFAALHELPRPAVHVLSATWSVPLPWFALVDPSRRRINLGEGRNDPSREISWRVTLTDAMRRVEDALELVEQAIGDSDPVRILTETANWLENFDPASIIELDYGGLVQLMDDQTLEQDSSAEEVHAILDALRAGRVDDLADLVIDVRGFWQEVEANKHVN